MKKGFTLIEMLISISILSLMMIFLYQSYLSLNKSNMFYKDNLVNIKEFQLKKQLIYKDFLLAIPNTKKIFNIDKKTNVVFMQSKNSVHKRYNPYIAYLVKNSKLYRLESLKEFKAYPLSNENDFVVDELGEVDLFKVYTSTQNNNQVLVDIDFKNTKNILLKI